MNKIIYAFLIAMIICFSMTVYSNDTEQDLQENVLRLHIIANSDSEEDQEVKLKVRDAILEKVKKEGTVKSVEEFKETANKVLKNNGFTYTANLEIGKFYFPEKSYKNLSFPSGMYNGMKVVLGTGKGQNWWCVMYPPLCFCENVDGELSKNGQEQLKNTVDNETYEIITEKPEIKFKIVEIVNGIMTKSE